MYSKVTNDSHFNDSGESGHSGYPDYSDDIASSESRKKLRERLDTVHSRAERATAWKAVTYYVGRLANREGYTPITARLSHDDLAFLTHARDDVLAFTNLALRLLELHEPRDAGAVSSTRRSTLRCRTCRWRWPCPTYQAIREALPDRNDD